MAIILDADVIIRGEKGVFDLRAWVGARADDEFAVAAITIAELWHGVERATGQHRAQRKRYLETIVSVLPIFPYTEQTAYVHAKLWAQLQTAGTMIGYYDLIVASTALERDFDLATFNKRHFSLVPHLRVIEPA
ncbi:MAG: PIN domain-containing protein [Pirellulales bacterium]|nr:PIN domain-containing protein [Pirellulales bacterium]